MALLLYYTSVLLILHTNLVTTFAKSGHTVQASDVTEIRLR